jgi:hypothetical protein
LNDVFFTDRDLGKRFPEILSAAGLLVEPHSDHFQPSTPDEEWLETVGRRGWIELAVRLGGLLPHACVYRPDCGR